MSSNLKNLLVTGASGFVGRHLLAHLAETSEYAVIAIGKSDRPSWLASNVAWQRVNLSDASSVVALPRNWWGIIHLAGATLPSQFTSPNTALDNLTILLPLLEHLSDGRVLIVSSALVYANQATAQLEEGSTNPCGRYGLSKYLAERAALAASHRLDIRIARPFNHIGSGMRAQLVIPSILQRIIDQKGASTPMRMEGVNSIRDFLDVRDIVSAYLAILCLPAANGEIFNVCSGIPNSIGHVAEAALALMGEGRTIEFSNEFNSTDDRNYLVGNPGKLSNWCGWRPKYDLRAALSEIIATDFRL